MSNYVRNFGVKNYENQTTTPQLIANNMSGCFFLKHGVVLKGLFRSNGERRLSLLSDVLNSLMQINDASVMRVKAGICILKSSQSVQSWYMRDYLWLFWNN